MVETPFSIFSNLAYLVGAILFIVGIKQMSKPSTARKGNRNSSIGMLIAIVVTLLDAKILSYTEIIIGIVIGSAIGAYYAKKVPMTSMPQMVALFNGFGGIASLLVAFSELWRLVHDPTAIVAEYDTALDKYTGLTSIALSILIGGVTFTGSLVAYGKLEGIITGKAVVYKGQHFVNLALFILSVVFSVWIILVPSELNALYILCFLSLLIGVLVVIPIGGADMPVVISLLNSYSGMAACTTGFVLNNSMLIITGALVGASGIILTDIMCKGMNRSIWNVLLGGFGQVAGQDSGTKGSQVVIKEISVDEAAMIFDGTSSMIIVPGYGMAVAQAQHAVKEFTDLLEKKNIRIRYAIHPVAGRMPGHMNVLLAEANVPYEQMVEMDNINSDFENTDVALIIGANDVTNPAARHDTKSPIFGMPILNVDKARTVIVMKRSMNPGYAGIDNELYGFPNCLMLFGDARKTMTQLVSEMKNMEN